MKKVFTLIIVSLIVFICPIYTCSAASESVRSTFAENFKVTGGINKSKDVEATFDKSRTISGIADVGSTVTIDVYEVIDDEELSEPKTYSVLVGSSGYFSQSVDLSIGENLITVTAIKDDATASLSATIKRKKSEIKSELSQTIAIPSI